MGLSFAKLLPVAALWLAAGAAPAQAQTSPTTARSASMMGTKPSAEADAKLAGDFINGLLVADDLSKVRTMLAANYKGYGPGTNSLTGEELLKEYEQNHKVQSNRKVDFVTAPVYLKTGDLQGQRVLMQGVYSCTSGGKDLKVPFTCFVHVSNGKIDQVNTYYDQVGPLLATGYKIVPPAAGN